MISHISLQDSSLRQFLLTNLVGGNQNGRLRWRINLSAIEESMNELKRFPYFESGFHGPTLFIGGGNSNYIS